MTERPHTFIVFFHCLPRKIPRSQMQLSCNNTLKTLINETLSAHLVNLINFFLNFFLLIIN